MSTMIRQPRCPGRARHWRIVWNTVGLRSPVCTNCGSPNPKPLSQEEWADLLYHVDRYGNRNKYLIEAINAWVHGCRHCGKQIIRAGRKADRAQAYATPDGLDPVADGAPWYCHAEASGPEHRHEPRKADSNEPQPGRA